MRSGSGSPTLVARHIEAVLRDLRATETVVQERAAQELFLLGSRGIAALRHELESRGNTKRGRERFLLNLLRWRIRPETYAQFGMDFHDYPYQQGSLVAASGDL